MPEPRLEHPTIKVRQLIDDYRSGRIVIPEFQREYVWQKKKAPKLIDSLFRGFPISSLLLWNSADDVRSRRRDPRPSRAGLINWLIDGQQRVITLSRCMNGDEGIDVVFHPDTRQFALENAATKKDPGWYRLADIWDDQAYLELRRTLPGTSRGTQREQEFEAVRKILDYEIPTVRMVDHSFDGAVEAFTRINTLGVKLKRNDIESARVAAKHTGFIADDVAPFLERLRKDGFSRMNVMHLFRACAFIAKPDGRDRTPLHELDRKDVQAAWNNTKRATIAAVNLIRSEFGLINMDILWSGALMVPLIALCATRSKSAEDSKAMAGWLAAAALLHRYSVASETALDQDLRACRQDDPIGKLLTNLRKDEGPITTTPEDFSGAIADRGGLFGVYVACRQRTARDIFSGANILLQPQIDRHHILPRGQFPERQRTSADCVANMAFVQSSTNRSVGLASPDVYLPRLSEAALASQCVPLDRSLWRIERAKDFWDARKQLLSDAFNDFLRESLPQRRLSA